MARIIKKFNKDGILYAYNIRVSRGYYQGKEMKPYQLTWNIPQGLTEKQVQKELSRVVSAFECDCARGLVVAVHIKLSDYIREYLDIHKSELKQSTYDRYVELLPRIDKGVGGINMDKLTVHDLNVFYKNLIDGEKRHDAKMHAIQPTLSEIMYEKVIWQAELVRRTGLTEHALREEAMQYNDMVMDEDFFRYVRADLDNGRHIFGSIWYIAQKNERNIEDYTAGQYYALIDHLIEKSMTDSRLGDAEKAWWYEKKASVERPFTFGYSGLKQNTGIMYSCIVFAIVMLASCMSHIFAQEHQRGTDAIILPSVGGRRTLYFAKTAAGLSFGVISGVLLAAELIGVYALMYGFDGLHYRIQITEPTTLYNMTYLSYFVLMVFLYILTLIFSSVIILFLSELTKNGVAVMVGTVVTMFLSLLISLPEKWRAVNTLYDCLPGRNMLPTMLSNYLLLSVGGLHIPYYWYMPALYLIGSVLLIFLGKRRYERFEIGK